MRITIESTEQIVQIHAHAAGEAIPARVWVGTTESGIPVQVLVTRIAPPASGFDLSQFERELQEHQPPQPLGQRAFDLRMVL